MIVGAKLPQTLVDAKVALADGSSTVGALLEGGSANPTGGHAGPERAGLVAAQTRAALILFLRHFGCTGCWMQIDALRPHLGTLTDMGLRVLLIGNGAARFIDAFVERMRLHDAPITLCTDESLACHRAVGLERSWLRTVGPTALVRELAARARGYRSFDKEGDVAQQAGALLIDAERRVVFFEAARYAAEPVAADVIVSHAMALLTLRARERAAYFV